MEWNHKKLEEWKKEKEWEREREVFMEAHYNRFEYVFRL